MVLNIDDKLSITPDFTYVERLAHNQWRDKTIIYKLIFLWFVNKKHAFHVYNEQGLGVWKYGGDFPLYVFSFSTKIQTTDNFFGKNKIMFYPFIPVIYVFVWGVWPIISIPTNLLLKWL